MSTLRVLIHFNGKTQVREVSKDSFSVGRSAECDIALNDGHISRIHLMVYYKKGEVWVEDKGSSNGTFINGKAITGGNLTSVQPADKIQLGKSEYIISLEVTGSLAKDTLPPVLSAPVAVASEEAPAPAAVVKAKPEQKSEPQAKLEPKSERPAEKKTAPVQEENVISDARKRAAKIILEGEAQAEKRVQAIYQKAKEMQAQAEKQYKERIEEAHKSAESIVEKYQEQGREILQEARSLAQELRDEVDAYVLSLKEKANSERAEFIRMGKEEGIAQAKEEASRIQSESQSAKESLQKTVADLKQNQNELVQLTESLNKSQDTLKDLEQKIQAKEESLKNLHKEEAKTQHEIKALEDSLQKLEDKQAQFSVDLSSLEEKRQQLQKDYEAQKIALNEKFEKEKEEKIRIEEERSEEMRIDLSRRQEKLEKELLSEVIRTKEDLIKSVFNSVEKEVVTVANTTQWGKVSANVEKKIRESIDEKVAAFSRTTGTQKVPENLLNKRKLEKTRWMLTGLVAGACALFVSQRLLYKLSKDQNPMQTMVQQEAKRKKDDLERRRFNPPQNDEVRDTFADSVIYTRGYVEAYGDPAFQKRMYKAASHYLFKTWRIDEDKAIQVLSATTALVKELQERKSKIHPDFVKEGLEKMRNLETEATARMKGILGSEVRLESFRRFEKGFFKDELQRRRMAQQEPQK